MNPQQRLDPGHTGPGGVGWQPNIPLSDQSSSTPPASMRSRQPGQKDSIEGEAHYIQHRQEAQQGYILTFRVERYDRVGNRSQPVPVEMRGYKITGFINEGDQVRMSGTWKGGLLQATRVDNVTTGAVVTVKRTGWWTVPLLVFLFLVIFIAFVLGFALLMGVISTIYGH
jgi:hypothetical protein